MEKPTWGLGRFLGPVLVPRKGLESRTREFDSPRLHDLGLYVPARLGMGFAIP